ncbi:Sel1 domain protein (macronuclear) [Tetrahymena thermophila SB210]|uniref:Sel1 domain protein n=1 Tax=Tetrahymena thermophila (strain SB210) TaxID=312017 RepID=A4VEN5_TETTS|nr:Sel1 domain protein [Tetrahymena thermophila SB210]EDK31987.1 Sel1 domain protein [Tetrahymena thermophila SB210]|eukprot:XP_001471147.1 Sel1 domain protein [Tetrahymena thermophila SB210]
MSGHYRTVISKFLLALALVQLCYSHFAINLQPKVSIKNLQFFSGEETKTVKVSEDALWKHTKKLIKYPYNLGELKTCLQKSYVYLNQNEAALLLGKFTLFEYPAEKAFKQDKFKDLNFCKNYPSNSDVNKQRLEALQKYDAVDSFNRNFAKALFYFHESEQLLNEDAPIYLLFMLWMSRFTENLNGIIDSHNLSFENLSTMLVNAATLRGSSLAYQMQLTEILQCMKLKNLDHNFYEMLGILMESKFQDTLKQGSDQQIEDYFATNFELKSYRLKLENKEYQFPEGVITQEQYQLIHYVSTEKKKPFIEDPAFDQFISEEDEEMLNEQLKEIEKLMKEEYGIEYEPMTITKEEMKNLKSQLKNIALSEDGIIEVLDNINDSNEIPNQQQKQSNKVKQTHQVNKNQQQNNQSKNQSQVDEKNEKNNEEKQNVDKEDKKFDNQEENDDVSDEQEDISDNQDEIRNKLYQLLNEKLKINNLKISKKITENAIDKIFDVLDSTIHFMQQDTNNNCLPCKYTLNIAGKVVNMSHEELNLSSDNLEEEDEDISLTDQLIFQNTDLNYQEMIDHYGMNPTNHAEEVLRRRADLGDLQAQLQLGVDYYRGNLENNIQQNHQQAFNYFQMAAEQGVAQAMFNTGLLLMNGQGTQKDGKKAKEYFQRAIELDEKIAYAGLAQLYLIGLDVPQNQTKAASYFEVAMRAGHQDSRVNLAILYQQGFDNVPKNVTKSIELIKPIVHNNKRAQIFMAIQYNLGKDIGMTCETLLGFMLKKEEDSQNEQNVYSVKSLKKYQAGKYEDALIYSIFASFMGYDQSYHDTGFLWKTLMRDQNNREQSIEKNLICSYNDYDLCSMIFYYKDALLHRNESFAQVGHQIFKGSNSFTHSYQLAYEIYNSTSYLPESLHSISYLYQNGYYVEKNLTKAIEYNDNIIKMVVNDEVEFKNIYPAILRKVFLFFYNLLDKFMNFFSHFF